MDKSIIPFMLLVLLAINSCGTFPVLSTPTPEKITFTDGEIDACLLISPIKVKEVAGIDVTSESDSTPDESYCRYVSVNDGQVPLLIQVMIYVKSVEENKTWSAAEWYEIENKIRSEKLPFIQTQAIDHLGDKAYLKDNTSSIDIIVLKTDVYYNFSTRPIEKGGLGYDALLELAVYALESVP